MARPEGVVPTKRSIDQGGRAVTILSIVGALCLAGFLIGLVGGLLS